MRVLIVNTSERTGGAAVAAGRLLNALNNNGVEARMLVRDKESDRAVVTDVRHKMLAHWAFLWERWCIFCHLHFKRKHLFALDTASAGADITRRREFREADVIHLHWVNQGMLSLHIIRKILRSGKPVVWTMHDIWPATAICHLTLDCNRFKGQCGNCRYLPEGGSPNDLSHKIWQRKQRLYDSNNISFVACSKWLAGEAKASSLLSGKHVTAIPNPIDTNIYAPADKHEARTRLGLPQDKRIILFIAQRATNPYKGMDYLVEACQRMAEEQPATKENTCVAILGGHSEELEGQFPFEAFPLGYVSDDHKIVDVYNAADVFVLPSLSENLPNTIMEAMACGVPCVGFRVGGIPEMIDHQKNGYVAAYRDAADLARGIAWTLNAYRHADLAQRAVEKVMRSYSEQSVAMRYIEVYNEALATKHYRL